MSIDQDKKPWIILKALIDQGDPKEIDQYIEHLTPFETARAISRLDQESQTRLLSILHPEDAADVLKDLPDEHVADLIEGMNPEEAAAIVDEMPSEDQVDLLQDMDLETAEVILDTMSPEDAQSVRQLLQYPEDTAGGIMSIDYLAYSEKKTIGDVLEDLRINREKYSDYYVQYAYITSETGALLGVIRMRDLPLTDRNHSISSIMSKNLLSVNVKTPLENLVQLFDESSFVGMPVVDEHNILVGVVSRKQVLEAEGERDRDSYLKTSGIIGGEELRSMPILERSRRRLSWLSINILLNIVAASIIAMYQDTLSAVIALAVFLPIISDMSGCSGNQAVAVSIREMTLGLVKPNELFRVFIKEIGVGLINGLILGVLLGAVAFLWKGNIYLGLVVGGALALNTVIAVCLGGLVPLILKWTKNDPALASGPILTTVTDMCGFLFALVFATKMLAYL